MHKSEFIDKVSANVAGSPGDPITRRDVEKVIDAALDQISWTLRIGDEVRFTGFGVFKTSLRTPTNPQSGEKMSQRRVPTFKAGSKLKEAVK